jgi:transglutaminase/protease-like cytokinesis protein 3
MRFFFVWLLLLLPAAASATDTLNTRLYQHAQLAPSTTNLRNLVAYLKQGTTSERERAEIIFYWIADHISYDCELEKRAYITPAAVSIDSIMRRQKTICSGYARLYAAMATYAGIECQTVAGTAANRFGEGMHSWNAVCIDKQWLLVDATWGSGGTVDQTDRYVKHLDLRYVFAEPKFLVTTHFPNNSRWQLLDSPISLGTFQGILWKHRREWLYQDEVFQASTTNAAAPNKKSPR